MSRQKRNSPTDNQINKLLDERDILSLKNDIAMRKDLDRRFEEYKVDPSVGGMYQRKKKTKKSKAKRCKCK